MFMYVWCAFKICLLSFSRSECMFGQSSRCFFDTTVELVIHLAPGRVCLQTSQIMKSEGTVSGMHCSW